MTTLRHRSSRSLPGHPWQNDESVAVSRIEEFPPELLDASMLDEVVAWLLRLPVLPLMRKVMIIEWCLYTGVKLTAEIVRRVYWRE